MDITPQLLKEVKFSESWRGYDRDEVDEFLERVGAGVAQVQGRLRESIDRAEAAEARAVALGGRSEAEDTLRRTLVLAQRTADAAVAEANETAARTVADAEARAGRIVADAEAHGVTLRAEAEEEVRRVAESTRAPLIDEIRELERVRGFLHDDIELLERHLDTQRATLRQQLTDLQALIDRPSMFSVEPAPATSGVDPAEHVSPPDEPPGAGAPRPTPAIEREDPVEPELRWGDLPPFASAAPAPAFEPGPPPVDPGPPTRPVPAIEAEDRGAGDAFLDQLRRAVDDDAPDGDHAMAAFFDQDDDDRPRSRFGRKR
jgi:cell division initiation protein